MTEALIHLAEHPNRDVCEIKVAPVEFGLDSVSSGTPAAKNRMEMCEDSFPNQMFGALEETKILRLASIAVVGRNGFVDEWEEVSVEGRIKPSGGLRCLFRRGKSILEFAGCHADFLTFIFEYDPPVDEKAKEQRTPRH